MQRTRRNFLNGLLGITGTTVLYSFNTAEKEKSVLVNKNLLPKALKKGATIGLAAPGYTFTADTLKKAKKTIKKMGYKTYHTNRISESYGYFSNTDEERATDLNELFANKKIDAILCIRGGYGCTRILHLLDYVIIKNNPKALIGFSDVTALLNVIHQRTGLISFHGPVGKTMDDVYSIKAFKDILENNGTFHNITNATLTKDLKTNPEYERYIIHPGTARGELTGGSLTLINALMGTPYEIDFTKKIVCIEDVEEAPYRIDRMLTQLLQGDTFKKAAGIVFGVCAGCDRPRKQGSFTLKEVLMDRIKPLEIPAVYGMSFGHIDQNFTFPIGINATMNTTTMKLVLEGPWAT